MSYYLAICDQLNFEDFPLDREGLPLEEKTCRLKRSLPDLSFGFDMQRTRETLPLSLVPVKNGGGQNEITLAVLCGRMFARGIDCF